MSEKNPVNKPPDTAGSGELVHVGNESGVL